MRLKSFSNASINRLRKYAQWEVDENNQAVPMGGYASPDSDLNNRVTILEQMVNQYGEVFQEWVNYLSNYNDNLANSINEIWADVNSIGNDVDQMRQKSETPQSVPQTGKGFFRNKKK